MRKTYQMLIALAVLLLGGTSAMAQNLVELEAEMFKSWSSPNADAVPTDETSVAEDGELSCAYAIFEQLGAGALVYGHTNVYYLWYADLTGTKTMFFEGTAGVQLRILMNRPEPVEGGDAHGGTTFERNVTLDADGKASLDVSDLPFVHLNAIKTGWGSPSGTIQKIELEGTVKPVSGWVNLINNSDMEGDDVSSFFSKEAPSTDVLNSTIEDGVGVDGSRAVVVRAGEKYANAWDSQFWFRFSEPVEPDAKYRVSFNYRADKDATVSTQAHQEPGDYIHYEMFGNLNFTSDWQTFSTEGTVTSAQSTAEKKFLSVAFNLNELAEANNYYFDNIVFEIYKEKSPLAQIKATFEADVVAIDFGGNSNIKQLVGSKKRVIYPNDCVAVTINCEPSDILSVEAKPDGRLYIFQEQFSEDEETDKVLVSFTNPTDPAYHLTFTDGRWAGQDVPSFVNIACDYENGLGNNFSYKADAPELVSADPEDGSFNLPFDLKEFHVVFDNPANASKISAKLDKEALTVSPADGFSKEFTFTRTGSGNIAAGVHTLYVNNVWPEEDWLGLFNDYELALSFGPVNLDSDDKQETLLADNFGADGQNNYVPAGWVVNSDAEERTDGTYGSGCRVIVNGANSGQGFTPAIMYMCSRGISAEVEPGHVWYGTLEEYPLHLTARNYVLTCDAATWDQAGTRRQMMVQVVSKEGIVIAEATQEVVPDYKTTTNCTHYKLNVAIPVEGDYILKFLPLGMDGNANGYGDAVALGNVKLEYIPSTAGVAELLALKAALEKAIEVRTANADARYEGTAYSTLDATIKAYENATFTSPTKCKAATDELNAVADAMNEHHKLCDTYDPLPGQAQEKVEQFAETKFAATSIYADLKAAAEKYADKVLKEDAELNAAIAELNSAINLANGMFTTGASKCNATGYAVLNERIRLGIDALKALGVADDDPVIVKASNVLGDDDAVAESLKNHTKLALYGKIKNGEDVFAPYEDPTTQEVVLPERDMTVFVKNPNIYRTNGSSMDFNEENIPGWVTPEGFSRPGISTGWSDPSNGNAMIPSDCMFQTWGSSYRVQQTITDLPAGVYTLRMAFGERMNEDENNMVGSFVFAKTSETPEAAEGEEEQFAGICDVPGIGQSYPALNTTIEEVLVADGVLTLGANGGSSSHTFFNEVRVVMTATAAGFDYGKAYDDVLSGIDVTVATPEKIRAIAIYDMNGRQIEKAQRGVNIVKQLMSDGSVRTVKVVVK